METVEEVTLRLKESLTSEEEKNSKELTDSTLKILDDLAKILVANYKK